VNVDGIPDRTAEAAPLSFLAVSVSEGNHQGCTTFRNV
jgi:hypothetical protein